jgi:hypothetical protein
MLPFTTMLLRLSLTPLEIARAYSEAFSSGKSIRGPELTTPKVDPREGAGPAAARSISSVKCLPAGQSTNLANAMNTQFYDNKVTTVNFQILFTKQGSEAMLDQGRVLVTEAMTDAGFASWQISLFLQRLNQGLEAANLNYSSGIEKPTNWTDLQAIQLAERVHPWSGDPPSAPISRVIGLKRENLKYLQVDHQIINAFDRKPSTDQVAALRDIASAIRNR